MKIKKTEHNEILTMTSYNYFINFLVLILFLYFVEHSGCIPSATDYVNTRRHKENKNSKDDFSSSQYEFKTSEDVDMDPCKTGTYFFIDMFPKVDRRTSIIRGHTNF